MTSRRTAVDGDAFARARSDASARSPADASPGARPDGCAWCGDPIPPGKRADSLYCGTPCRQASWRFAIRRADQVATERPMRFAYADPPYPGKANIYPERREVDHASLLEQLTDGYPDGWALSTSSEALRHVWALCPPETRLHIWVKAPRRTKARQALRTWEALLVAGGRQLPLDVPQDLTDALVYRGRFRAFPGALTGMKPPAFAEWMFRLLGAAPGDTLDDLYPGSGAIGVAWARHTTPSTPSTGDASRRSTPDASTSCRADG